MIRKSIARSVAAVAAVAALAVGLAGSASAVADEPREHGSDVDLACVNDGITLLGCTQVTDVLDDLELDVLSDLLDAEDVLPVSDVVAQVPVAGDAENAG